MEGVANRFGLYKKEYDPYFAQLYDVEIETLTQLIRHRQPVHSQITWKGGPAELAYLMHRLAEEGYVEAQLKVMDQSMLNLLPKSSGNILLWKMGNYPVLKPS